MQNRELFMLVITHKYLNFLHAKNVDSALEVNKELQSEIYISPEMYLKRNSISRHCKCLKIHCWLHNALKINLARYKFPNVNLCLLLAR